MKDAEKLLRKHAEWMVVGEWPNIIHDNSISLPHLRGKKVIAVIMEAD